MDNKPVIGIIGTGMIASSMAVLGGGHGIKTILLARSEASVNRCKGVVNDYYDQMVEQNLITREQVDICQSYISYVYDYSKLSDVSIVFESVVEDLKTKYDVYKAIEDNCPNTKVICSVSSSIVPEDLAKDSKLYGDRIIVAHPFNPPHMVPYFELCGSSKTAKEALDYAVEVLRILDRKPVVLNKPTPGFIGNRLQFALWREALSLVEEGICAPEDIDTCLQYSFSPRYTSIGIFEHFDTGGLILNATGCKNIWPVISNRTQIPDFMQELINQGKLGPKSPSQTGFYDWTNVDMKAYSDRVCKPYWALLDWVYPDKPSK